MTDKLEIELVDSALQGDIESFGQLCATYYNSMAAIAYSVLSDHHLAEDAAQEAFARALKNLGQLKNKEKFGFWLGQICRNVAKDMVKAKSMYTNTGEVLLSADSSEEKHESEAVRQAINKLSSSERELIILRYYNNMSQGQIQSVLGLSRAVINMRLFRVRRKIAKYLHDNGFTEVEL